VAIKVNLLRREEAAPARPGVMRVPKLAVGGGRIVQVATAVLVLVILGLGVMGVLAWNAKTGYAKEVTELKKRNDALKAQLTELRVAEEAKRDIQRRLDVIGRVAKSQGVPVAMMNGVLKSVPQGIWLTSFEMKPQEVKVKVETRSVISPTGDTLEKLEAKKQEVGAAPSGTPGAPGAKPETKEVVQLQGYNVVIKGVAFNNFQIADFMENLRKVGVFADVDFVVTQAERVEQTRVTSFEVTATVKL